MNLKFKSICPKCGKVSETSLRYINDSIICSSCHTEFSIIENARLIHSNSNTVFTGKPAFCNNCHICLDIPWNAVGKRCPHCQRELEIFESTEIISNCKRKNEYRRCKKCNKFYEIQGDGEGNLCPECHHKFETFDEPEVGSYN